ncbi:MAG: 1-acyl-sn-glycerol-3-phosphate acyltransferase [Pyrinomonadaceae bacterium]|nr:1-acyl-sn-glycerol-3-phosphate acyltransferase [Pyrinomonadaceae bacterium]
MTKHPFNSSSETLSGENYEQASADESSTQKTLTHASIAGRLHYWWSLLMAAILLLLMGPPVLFVAWLFRRPHWVYPFARFGARNWLRLSGMEIKVRGLEHLDPDQTYIFISNHRSYLDTATLFNYTGRRIGILAKKELLKVPILGQGMGYVNIMAIDRTNRESAMRTVKAATDRIRSGRSFGVFAEGTRACPGELLSFKKGAFYMARDAGVSIVPVAMKNTDRLMGKGTGVSRPGTIEMVLLPPIDTTSFATDEDIKRLVKTVRTQIADELSRS